MRAWAQHRVLGTPSPSRSPRLLASRPSPRTWRRALCSALGLLSQLLPPLRAAAHTGGGTRGLTAAPRPHPRVCFLVAHLSLKDAPPFPHDIPGNTSPEDLARAFGPQVPGASLASGPCHMPSAHHTPWWSLHIRLSPFPVRGLLRDRHCVSVIFASLGSCPEHTCAVVERGRVGCRGSISVLTEGTHEL